MFPVVVAVIGIAILVTTKAWWPGILLVIGLTKFAQGIGRGRTWYHHTGGLWLVVIGLFFMKGVTLLSAVLIAGFLAAAISWAYRLNDTRVQRPMAEAAAHTMEKAKRDSYMLVDEAEDASPSIEDLLRSHRKKRNG